MCACAAGCRRRKPPWSHWINYLQEQPVVETPIPIGPIAVEIRCPGGYRVEAIDWRYPYMKAPEQNVAE